MSSPHTVYLSLGTNLGDRSRNLQTAIESLSPSVRVQRTSPVYETEPWGFTDQPSFYNQVVEGLTDLSPLDLLDTVKQLEVSLGREPSFLYGPRKIDIDILFYEDQVIHLPRLTLPHPLISERAFVLVPLADLAPNMQHPVLKKTIQSLLSEIDWSSVHPVQGSARAPRPFPLAWGQRTYIMGILNLTPDSFSGDGLMTKSDLVSSAVEQAHRFVAAGADILDIGGESTRPGSAPVTLAEELNRVLPVVRALVAEGLEATLSIDTYKAKVAEAALQAGADWINDVWALRADPDMASIVTQHQCPIILMHNRIKPNSAELQERLGGRYTGIHYKNLIEDVKRELLESVALARAAGISDHLILLDPGLGFGKTVEQSLELLNRLDEIRKIGFPILLGPSRKSFIGYTLNLPSDQRVEGTAAAVAIGIVRGADIIRVHDVEAMVRVARMTDAVVRRTHDLQS
jgi:dihydropteroate synthase/2-amino-4-hydroxy-6-hydroxymethyldihydropteridine diphosphokinase